MQSLLSRFGFKVIRMVVCVLGVPLFLPIDTIAQTPAVSAGTTSGSAGTAVDLAVSFSAGDTGISTLQFDVALPAPLSYVSVTTGPAAAAAGKSASGSVISGGVRVLAFGLNQNTIGSGAIAVLRLNIASGTAPATLAVGIAGISASSPSGEAVSSGGAGGSVTTGLESVPLPSRGAKATPSPDAIFITSVIENADFRTNLGINNLSPSKANVGVVLVDGDGIVLASKAVEVEPAGLKQINRIVGFLYDSNPPQSIRGTLYLESHQIIRAWVSQIENVSNDPSLLFSKRSGAHRILIPSAANISTFRSSLVLMNVGSSTAEVAVKVYGTDGSLLGQTPSSLFIPSNGTQSFENILQTLGVSNNYGPIEITSLNNVPIIASSRVSSVNGTAGFFESLDYADASLMQFIPHVIDTNELRTNIGINNVSDSPATVRVRLIGKNGVERGITSVPVAPKGLTQLNHVVRLLVNVSEVSNLEGYIRLESDQPIFGWSSQIDNATNDPGFTVGSEKGFSRLIVQSAANVGTFRSSLVAVNTGDADALVEVVSRGEDGKIQGQLGRFLIPAKGFFGSSNILASLGVSSSFGPIEIISLNEQPLMVTSRVYSFSGTSGFLQGQAIE